MEWMKAIGEAVDYIESNITENITVDDVAKHVCISTFYFQKGFSMLCGYSIMEYIRNRRLALAGVELTNSDAKIIDIAMMYGYDSPDSFTKAFSWQHTFSGAKRRSNANVASKCE